MEQVVAGRKRILRPSEGRDEFNLAEFPLTLLTDRTPRELKTLRWEDEITDRSTNLPVKRQVIVTGSDAFGLPTASDADVLFALVQLTKLKNNFSSKDVQFSRYELLRILDWRDEGKSYRRLEDSLDRWHGTSIYFSAWRDKETETWRSEKFHILDNVSLLGRTNRRQLLARGQGELAFSSFSWNKIVFRNLQTGYVCPVDLDTYFSLKSAISKRMLRYLSKHFRLRQQPELTFNLGTFAFEKVGLSRSYRDNGQLKKELQPALDELEAIGFLAPMTREERYTKLARGAWTITLIKAKPVIFSPAEETVKAPIPEGPHDELILQLTARGVTLEAARALVEAVPELEIVARLKAYDWLFAKGDARASRNPAGYLIQSIRHLWPLPRDFVRSEEIEQKRRRQEEARRKVEETQRQAEAEERAREEAEQKRIRQFWDGRTPAEQEEIRAQALTSVSPFLVQLYRRAIRETSDAANVYMKLILNEYITRLLDQK
jgi:hypothetical protein